MDDSSRELKINTENIKIFSHAHHLLPQSIILLNQNLKPWFLENFVQINSYQDFQGNLKLDFPEYYDYYSDVIDIDVINLHWANGLSDIIDLIIGAIERGEYIVVFIDEFYLPDQVNYRQYHMVRQLLVYGYRGIEKKLLCLGFMVNGGNGRGQYYDVFREHAIDFNVFLQAYTGAKDNYEETAFWAAGQWLVVFRPIEFAKEYPFSASRFKERLGRFIFSVVDEERNFYINEPPELISQIRYGFSIYEEVKRRLDGLLEGGGGIDFRTFYLLYEHKKGLLERFQFITQRYPQNPVLNKLVAEFESCIFKKFEAMYLNFLKYEFRPNPLMLERIISGLPSVTGQEYQLLAEIHQILGGLENAGKD